MRSLGIKRGTLGTHPKWGKAYVGGTMDGKLSLYNPQTGKQLTQSAKVDACKPIKLWPDILMAHPGLCK